MNRRSYAVITSAYWAFTLTDGALRMLVLLHFHDLGYDPVSLAFLFLLYELFGVAANLFGGWFGARSGLNRTLVAGLTLQVAALIALAALDPGWTELASVVWVMGAQALSGIAKDLTKMSSKSAVRFVVDDAVGPGNTLFRLIAVLTGSKNALKGVGFFLGAALLAGVGFESALVGMAGSLALVALVVVVVLDQDMGRSSEAPKARSLFSVSAPINRLAAARFFLFASRDVWFVVALPVFLSEQLGWSFEAIGAFLACWVIGYGLVQSMAPRVLRTRDPLAVVVPAVVALGLVAAAIGLLTSLDVATRPAVLGGLVIFGVAFALNSSVHSYLVVALSTDDRVTLDVGFYYAANAAGRLVGTLASGVLYMVGGLDAALWGSTGSLAVTALLSVQLRTLTTPVSANPG
ncbi:MAG: organoarsenical effux MFS transporter ArsJ [Acidimicrobiales bacterium]